MSTTQDIIQYYSNLLVLQYLSDTGVQTITTFSDFGGSLQSTYFLLSNGINEPSGPYAVWFNVSGGGTAPSIPGFTNVEVDIVTGASANTVATALSNALNTLSQFDTSAVGNIVTVFNDPTTPFAIAGDYNTGFVYSKNNAVETIQTVVSGTVMNQLPLQVENAYNLNPTQQELTFSAVPASGSFTLDYGMAVSGSIAWNATQQEIQNVLNQLLGYNLVAVNGTALTGTITIDFNSIPAPQFITVGSNTLETSAPSPVTITVSNNVAQGVQLDVLGKYAGVTRSGVGSSGPITLDDADFLKLIQIAIVQNSNGSSLYDIVSLLNTYFPGEIEVFDLANTSPMNMTYYINSTYISQQLLELFIAEGLLPHPMAVGLSVIVYSNLYFFGFCDYVTATPTESNTPLVAPFNCANTIQSFTVSQSSTSGQVTFNYNGMVTPPITYADTTAADVQAVVDSFFGPGIVTVTLSGFTFTLTFNSLTPNPYFFSIDTNTLENGSTPTTIILNNYTYVNYNQAWPWLDYAYEIEVG